MIKANRKLGVKGMYLNQIKVMHDKPIANIILNRENMKQVPLKSGIISQGVLSFHSYLM
jgi:hypothetical protein